MKRSELEIGKVYAYSRSTNPTNLYEIEGFIVDSLDPTPDWRGRTNPQEITGRFTDTSGNPKPSTTTANTRRLVGDYLTLKHDLEIRDKNKQIAQLNKQIASTQVEGLIKTHHELITNRLDINFYDIRNQYDGKATITLNADQFNKLIWAFQALNRHEDYAKEQERIRLQKAYEQSQEVASV